MKRIVVAIACVAAVAAAAHGTDKRSLAEFMSKCNAASRECHNTLHDYVDAASQQNMICLPAGLSVEEAADDMRTWMRHAVTDPALAAGNVEDGQWAAVSTLWPCQAPGAGDTPPPADAATPPADATAPSAATPQP
jgi:hypothetical protein